MKNAFLKLFAILTLGLFIVACSSPDEKAIEKQTGFKLSELKEASKLKEDYRALNKIFPISMEQAVKMEKKGRELDKKMESYRPVYESLKKVLEKDPELYGRTIAKDYDYEQAIVAKLKNDFYEALKADPQSQEIAKNAKAFTDSLDKTKLNNDPSYVAAMFKEYNAKFFEKLNARYKEFAKEFLEQHKSFNLDAKQKQEIVELPLYHPVYNIDKCYWRANCFLTALFGLKW